MIKVSCDMKIIETDEKEKPGLEYDHLIVKSHWNDRGLVVLSIGEHTYAVVATDLIAAIQNATRTG